MTVVRDIDAVGFTFNGENLCRHCTHDVLEAIVYENAYRTPDEMEGLGIFNLMRVCDQFHDGPPMTTGTEAYDTEAFDSGDFPKAFEDAEPDELCMNPECRNGIQETYNTITNSRNG